MKDFSDSPRPFIIEPDLDPKTEYLEGEHFFFDLVIFGDAIQFFPYFVLTFRELTSQGIGKTRGKAALERIDFHGNGETKTMYREQDGLLSPNFEPQTGKFLLNGEKEILKDSQDLTVRFKTMTRLQYRGHLVEFPHFHILFRNLVRRISALLFLYHGSRMELDYSQLFSLAEKVDLKNNLAVWVDWARYSRRQQEKMFMGGLIGETTYCFEKIEPDFFLPFLIAGQVTHVGKGTVFGLGKYEIV
ncbi:MAG: CRISPR system precrRNA processing endoribonuclease RAMP protein Cas6 [Caldiserica bacterium]|nr:CRISPR system precrRNA processing endoribonuclease RAMP protein Cas6 [Caldisericota bacterium]MDH7562824.1 CRISPR system precrRNA processing endoribonuclease RAMP protein Cas6 [Caldisericota bacterium]